MNRAIMRARVDMTRKRVDLDQGDFSRVDTRPAYNVGVAITGSLDFSGETAFGIRCCRDADADVGDEAPVAGVRRSGRARMGHGAYYRRDGRACRRRRQRTFGDLQKDGPPTPEDGLAVDIETSGSTVRPVDDLPAIRDADLNVHVTGKTAVVGLGRGTVEVTPGRKLNVAGGVFEVPNTHIKPPPARCAVPGRRYGTGGSRTAGQQYLARHSRASHSIRPPAAARSARR